MNYKLGLSIFIVIIITACSTFLFMFKLQDNRQVTAEWWLKNVIEFKELAAEQTLGPKIIISSGSNSLFSINSKIIAEKTGMPVVNISSHAGLDIDYHYYLIKKHFKPGDVVVMPLEFEYYNRSEKPTDWFVNNMTGWGGDYLSSVNYYQYFKFLMNVTPKRLLDGFKAKNTSTVAPLKDVIDQYNVATGAYNGYSFKSLNKNGDISVKINGKTVYDSVENGDFAYGSNVDIISEHTKDVLNNIKSTVLKNNGHLIVTWPVTMRNQSFDTSNSKTMENLAKIRDSLAKIGIDIKCSPSASNLGSELFMDSPYHTNGYGADIRSSLLGDCLYAEINNKGGYSFKQNFRAVVLEMERKTPYYK